MDFDFNKLYQNSLDNIFTDLELVIEDSISVIKLNVHKIILICSSEYFHKMLLFDKSKTVQHMYVDNAQIMRDVVLSFYGVKNVTVNPKWKYLLETMKCRNYLCLPNDVSLLYDLKVPADGFELLLQVLELFDVANDRKLMRVIKNNLPKDYDLGNFSSEMVNKLSKKKNLIVSGSADNSIKIWDADSGELIKTLNGHTLDVNSVAFSNDGHEIVSGSDDFRIKIWDVDTGQLINTLNEVYPDWDSDTDQLNNILNEAHTDWVRSVAFSCDGQKIVSGSNDCSIKFWDADSGQLIHTLNRHTDVVRSVAFSPNGQKIISGSYDHRIKIWNANSYQLIHTLNGHSDSVLSVAFSSDSQKIVSGSSDGSIKIWDANLGQLIHTLNRNTNSVNSVAFSKDGQKIVSSSDDDKHIKIWNANSGQLINILNGHTDRVLSVAFLNNDQQIVSGSDDNSIKIWDANSGQLINTLNGHSGSVWSVACSNS